MPFPDFLALFGTGGVYLLDRVFVVFELRPLVLGLPIVPILARLERAIELPIPLKLLDAVCRA